MDLEGVLRVPWNPPLKDKFILKNLPDTQGRKAFIFEIVSTTYLL